jgi:glycine/D-amino acid oxidase-like deaminating enzyme
VGFGNTEKANGSDVMVLGAGIIGVCIALHLQARGRSVLLVDKGDPGGETSHGNAGLIERASVIPYAMPRNWLTLLGYRALLVAFGASTTGSGCPRHAAPDRGQRPRT